MPRIKLPITETSLTLHLGFWGWSIYSVLVFLGAGILSRVEFGQESKLFKKLVWMWFCLRTNYKVITRSFIEWNSEFLWSYLNTSSKNIILANHQRSGTENFEITIINVDQYKNWTIFVWCSCVLFTAGILADRNICLYEKE